MKAINILFLALSIIGTLLSTYILIYWINHPRMTLAAAKHELADAYLLWVIAAGYVGCIYTIVAKMLIRKE